MNKTIKNKNTINIKNFTTGMKKIFLFFISIYIVFGAVNFVNAAMTATGFIPGQIWYSKDPFVEGDSIRIYTAIWNNSTSPMSAKVEFYDKNVILGTRDVVVAPSNLEDVYVSWKVTAGDHLISAKIISPSITTSGKKETISVSNNITEVDKRFVPVVVKTVSGETATSTDVIKSQVDKATSSITDMLPESISVPASEGVGVVDNFRTNTFDQISQAKVDTEKKIAEIKSAEGSTPSKTGENSTSKNTGTKPSSSDTNKVSSQKVGVDVATEKPIAYIKLFFLSVLSFVFGSKLVFYSLIVLLIFFILRFIYRKIRYR